MYLKSIALSANVTIGTRFTATVALLDTSDTNVSLAILLAHNQLRALADEPLPAQRLVNLTWDETIANQSRHLSRLLAEEHCEKWANRSGPLGGQVAAELSIAPRETTVKEISVNDSLCGENQWVLYTLKGHPLNFTWHEATEAWTSRRFDLSFGCNVNNYTQMVWNDSTTIGCGAFHCATGNNLFVLYQCLYCPK